MALIKPSGLDKDGAPPGLGKGGCSEIFDHYHRLHISQRTPDPEDGKCRICHRKYFRYGLCLEHARIFYDDHAGLKTCAVSSCEYPPAPTCAGLCSLHFDTWKKKGYLYVNKLQR